MNKLYGVLGILFVLAGCGNPNSGFPDPAGTVTSQIQKEGQGQNAINFETGVIETGVLNTFTELSVDSAANFAATVGVKDLGFVSDLGAITSRDPSNSALNAPAVAGHGYLASTVSGLLVGIYVENDLTNGTNGGVVGKTINWNLFLPAADSNNPFSGLWRGQLSFNIVNGSDNSSSNASGQIALYIVQAGASLTGKAIMYVPAGGGSICGDNLTGSSNLTGTVSANSFSISIANSPAIFSCGSNAASGPAVLAITGTGTLNSNQISGTINMSADNGSGGITISSPLALTRQ